MATYRQEYTVLADAIVTRSTSGRYQRDARMPSSCRRTQR